MHPGIRICVEQAAFFEVPQPWQVAFENAYE